VSSFGLYLKMKLTYFVCFLFDVTRIFARARARAHARTNTYTQGRQQILTEFTDEIKIALPGYF
jgi:hypothetical protein